nr:hypothetical protein [Tanacetum cinerariifolium]
DTKLLSAPVSNKIEAYRLFRRNVPVTTLASRSVHARPMAYTLAGALFLPDFWPDPVPFRLLALLVFAILLQSRAEWPILLQLRHFRAHGPSW